MNDLNHLAIIMDGNGRWAEKQNLERWRGHEKGLENIKNICELCLKFNIKNLSLFALSSENLFRPSNEIIFLIGMIDKALDLYSNYILKNKIIFNFFGNDSILNNATISRIKNLQVKTNEEFKSCNSFTLNIGFNYGGRQEILSAIQKILSSSLKNSNDSDIKNNIIDEKTLRKNLYLPEIPDPDFIIRTGGHQRLSNFLLWQAAYSELYFCEDLWPEFGRNEFEKAMNYFFNQKRNFGMIS